MRSAVLCVVLVFWFSPVAADVSALPQWVQDVLEEAGPGWYEDRQESAAKTREVFTALHRTIPDGDLIVHRDVEYGDHPLQRFDVYRSEEVSNAPILVFMHGGAYVRGSRNENEEISSNIARYFARNGIVVWNIDYRLAPEAAWPEAASDLGIVVQWVRANADRYGGDSNRVYLMGSSAGATHVATYTYNRSLHPNEGPGVAGVILIGGRYSIEAEPNNANLGGIQAYFGSDVSLYPERSVITQIANGPSVPGYIVVAEYENRGLDIQGAELFIALCKRNGRCPRFSRLEGHNHLSTFLAINTADDELGKQALEFMRRGE